MLLTIRTKMLIYCLAMIVFPIAVWGFLTLDTTKGILEAKAEEASLRTVENARSFFIDEFIKKTSGTVEILSADQGAMLTARGISRAIPPGWDEIRKTNPYLAAVYIGCSDGRGYLTPDPGAELADPRGRPWYQKSLLKPDVAVWSDVYRDSTSGVKMITVSKAIVDKGSVVAVVGADISLDKLNEVVRSIQFVQGGNAVLVNAAGQVLAHKDSERIGDSIVDEPWYGSVRGSEGIVRLETDGQATYVSYIDVPQTGWKLIGFIPESGVQEEIGPIQRRALAVGLMATLAAVLLAVVLAYETSKRVRRLTGAMAQVEKGNYSVNWEDDSSREFHDLSKSFNAMTDTLRTLHGQEIVNREALMLQKTYFEQLYENSPESILILTQDDRIERVNRQFEALFQFTADEVVGKYVNDLIVPDELLTEAGVLSSRVLGSRVVEHETVRRRKDGKLIDVSILGYPIIVLGHQVGAYAIYRDISERKETERKLIRSANYDTLTQVFNRSYFESTMQMFEEEGLADAGVVICDIDGLKLVNDTLGHAVGDQQLVEAAELLQEFLPTGAVLCRIGGDEFAMLLPATDEKELQDICDGIKRRVVDSEFSEAHLSLSMSLGYAVRGGLTLSLADVFREADSAMYREKLHRSNSTRSAIVKTLTEALHARDFITEGHADRMQNLAERLGRAIGLSERKIGDIRLLAQFHDIGKVGIPDSILFKPGPLNDAERQMMRRHSEIGYRIAVASPDFNHIADWILKHHECWDGGGYPLGLKGEEIPLECRILLITDAFDAMTSDRPYRSAMTSEEALAEIRACSGKMFDPELAAIFLSMITEDES